MWPAPKHDVCRCNVHGGPSRQDAAVASAWRKRSAERSPIVRVVRSEAGGCARMTWFCEEFLRNRATNGLAASFRSGATNGEHAFDGSHP
jgi:hypothetical protein